jgi:hypothetical protein
MHSRSKHIQILHSNNSNFQSITRWLLACSLPTVFQGRVLCSAVSQCYRAALVTFLQVCQCIQFLLGQQRTFILLFSDDDALMFAHCDAPLPVHTMGECVSASALLVYLCRSPIPCYVHTAYCTWSSYSEMLLYRHHYRTGIVMMLIPPALVGLV